MPPVTGMRVRITLRYQPFAHALMLSVLVRPPLDLGGLGADRRGLPRENAGRRFGACQSRVDGFTLQAPVRV